MTDSSRAAGRPGRPRCRPGSAAHVPPSPGRIRAHPVRRDSAPECEAGAPPDIPRGCIVVLLRRTHHSENSGQRAGFSATAQISRRDFGIDINIPMDGGGVAVGDKMSISLEIEAVVQK